MLARAVPLVPFSSDPDADYHAFSDVRHETPHLPSRGLPNKALGDSPGFECIIQPQTPDVGVSADALYAGEILHGGIHSYLRHAAASGEMTGRNQGMHPITLLCPRGAYLAVTLGEMQCKFYVVEALLLEGGKPLDLLGSKDEAWLGRRGLSKIEMTDYSD